MSNYIPIHERPHYVEAFEDGRKNGADPKTGHGMATFHYGRPKEDDPDYDKIDEMNTAWLTGWFTGSSEWAEKHPDPRVVKYDTPRPMNKASKGDAGD